MTTSKNDADTHSYYLYAQEDEGKFFLGWKEGSSLVSQDRNFTVTISASSTDSSKPTSKTYTAQFADALPALTLKDNPYVCTCPATNKVGQKVTISTRPQWTQAEGQINQAYVFDGWYDQDGNVFSHSSDTTFVIPREMELEPRWTILDGQIDGPGYYRIANMYHDYVQMVGDQNITFSTSTTKFSPDLLWYNHPCHWYYGYKSGLYDNNMYAEPSIIFYVDGTLTGENYKTYSSKKEVMSGVTLEAQGVRINDHVKYQGSCPPLSIVWSGANKSQYHVLGTVQGFTGAFKVVWDPADTPVMMKNNSDAYDDMHFEAVDLEHVDSNWFGVFPDAEMEDEDGYFWASMYTSFPYQCYEPDGVEAYYVAKVGEQDGEMIAALKQLEDGIVPPHTPVVLKCPKVIDTTTYLAKTSSANSLWHAVPAPANRLVPLAPTAELEALAQEIAQTNALAGTYQLATHTALTFGSSMRVLSTVNGVVGFYKLADGTPLAGNRAYLQLPAGVTAAHIRMVDVDDYTGIDDVTVETPADGTIYDLYGRAVRETVPGQIYIRAGRKFIAK